MVVLPQLHLVRDYLRDSARAGRCPSVAVVRVPDASSDEWSLTQWIRGSDGAIGQIRLVLLTDCTVDPPNRSALLVAAAAEGAMLESVVAEALTHRQ